MIKEIEISRFTFFYDIHEISSNSSSDSTNNVKLDDWIEINLTNNDKDKELPFCSNFQNIWESAICSDITPYSKKTVGDCEVIIIHPFTQFDNKVIIFETKITKPLNEFKTAISAIKKDREKVYRKLIKSLLPNWKGDYIADGDYFYFVNLPLDSLHCDMTDNNERDKMIIDDVIQQLTIENKSIFQHLDFSDKDFPDINHLNRDISFIVNNDIQPLIMISPIKESNKLIILDDRLFVRCYDVNKGDRKSLLMRLVITVLLYQRAFIEYASKASIHIINNDSSISYQNLQLSFTKFIDNFWRIDISNSQYLNKSYRIIGKLWRLNERLEILRHHLTRNADIEEKNYQKKLTTL